MSTINVTNLKGRGGASPNLPDGANVTGVVTATSFVGSGANLTGIANTDFVVGTAITMATGNIGNVNLTKSAGGAGATVGSYTGVTTYYGDGSNLTGVGETLAPWGYNPDVNDVSVAVDTGIGITFNKKILAGSGTATIKIVNAGAAGTITQSWGVSSCTFDVQKLTFGSLVSNLSNDITYQLDIPEGFLVDGAGTDYVGTAYTFTVAPTENKLFGLGNNTYGILGQNSTSQRSSPVQITGVTWNGTISPGGGYYNASLSKTDGTLWSWGYGGKGQLGVNNRTTYSSPVQVPGTTWSSAVSVGYHYMAAIKTDGTLWSWGGMNDGNLGHNNETQYSSPVQIPGTSWPKTGDKKMAAEVSGMRVVKTDGTLWAWGNNAHGGLGDNSRTNRSSPSQVGGGTDWATVMAGGEYSSAAIKTDGTLWTWGNNAYGQLGDNSVVYKSSPVQVPGTTWSLCAAADLTMLAIKTDNTLWSWGNNSYGELGQGQDGELNMSSPTQVPGNWSYVVGNLINHNVHAIKTDGTLWAWGRNSTGALGQNTVLDRSSPVQVGADTGYLKMQPLNDAVLVTQLDVTP